MQVAATTKVIFESRSLTVGRGLEPAADLEPCNFSWWQPSRWKQVVELNIEMELVSNNNEAIKRTVMAALKKKKTEMMHFDL